LWSSDVSHRKQTLVAWNTLQLANEGWHGQKGCIKWNIAIVTKLVCHIARKAHFLWIKCVNHYYLKSKTIWQCKFSCKSSWYWRKILKAKDTMQGGSEKCSDTWLQSPTGTYNETKVYERIRCRDPFVVCYVLVWHKSRI